MHLCLLPDFKDLRDAAVFMYVCSAKTEQIAYTIFYSSGRTEQNIN